MPRLGIVKRVSHNKAKFILGRLFKFNDLMPTEKMISTESGAASSSAAPARNNLKTSAQWRSFWRVIVILAVCFSVPLFELAKFASGAELYSYILLMPFICWYLVNLKKAEMPPGSRPRRGVGLVFLLAGAGLLGYYVIERLLGGQFEVQDGLAFTSSSFYLFFIGAALALLGKETMRIVSFPFGM